MECVPQFIHGNPPADIAAIAAEKGGVDERTARAKLCYKYIRDRHPNGTAGAVGAARISKLPDVTGKFGEYVVPVT